MKYGHAGSPKSPVDAISALIGKQESASIVKPTVGYARADSVSYFIN